MKPADKRERIAIPAAPHARPVDEQVIQALRKIARDPAWGRGILAATRFVRRR
jgi:hypothetical protein